MVKLTEFCKWTPNKSSLINLRTKIYKIDRNPFSEMNKTTLDLIRSGVISVLENQKNVTK